MPNIENLKLWVKALRSGKYKQGRGALRLTTFDEDDQEERLHCCLGVGCDVYIQQTGLGRWRDNCFIDKDGTEEDADFPCDVYEWLGLDDSDPMLWRLDELGIMRNATLLNDKDHYTFDQIADAIEKTFNLSDEVELLED